MFGNNFVGNGTVNKTGQSLAGQGKVALQEGIEIIFPLIQS